MKISFITTMLNEERTVLSFLESIYSQTKLPNEIIIVDGGSTDKTLRLTSDFFKKINIKNIKTPKVKIIIKKGNRSKGRNEAIKNSNGEIIVCSDAGCILDKNWLKNITKPFKDKNVDCVSGYYKGETKSIFERCLIPYVLVMPDKIDPNNFLPSTRSFAFKRNLWKEIGGFPEDFSNNEDYVFAKKIKKSGIRIIFKKNAIVKWIPRKNIQESFWMFYRFAQGDAQAKILRPKVFFLFIRYLMGIGLLLILIKSSSKFIGILMIFLLFLYVLWSIAKNYKYVKAYKAFIFLPILQLTSDFAILIGTLTGLSYNSKHRSNKLNYN